MPPLTAPQLLDAWEQGLGRPQMERALLLLAAMTGEPRDELARLSIGRRDALLLDARAQVFGPRLTSVSACPVCGERMEATFEVSDLRVGPEGGEQREAFELSANGYQIHFRLPDSLEKVRSGTICMLLHQLSQALLAELFIPNTQNLRYAICIEQ